MFELLEIRWWMLHWTPTEPPWPCCCPHLKRVIIPSTSAISVESSKAFCFPSRRRGTLLLINLYSAGLLILCCVSLKNSFNKGSLVRLWAHEALRVFGDRLTDDGDRKWFNKHLETMCATRFSVGFYDTFKHLDTEVTKSVGVSEMRSLLFGDYMSTEESKPYEEIRSMHDLHHRMEEFLSDYNSISRKPMDLVMFGFAIEHISRVSRILKMPGGNALLVGVGGSGRQSVTRLATHMANYSLYQIEISKNYSALEWREDLKNVLKSAGCTNTPVTFLFTDSQIKKETFVEDINNMLNNGEVSSSCKVCQLMSDAQRYAVVLPMLWVSLISCSLCL